MAASADASALVVEPTSISPEYESIRQCVRELYTSFDWHKKKANITDFMERLTAIVVKQDTTLETMERVSLEHCMKYNEIFGNCKHCIPYHSIEKKKEININYISVPYIIYPGEDNTTWVIFRTAASFIPEITSEMMDVIKYLGVVRVFISAKFKKAIPYFPDNVIQIHFYSRVSLISSDNINFGIPKYLLGFYDCTLTYNSSPIPLGYSMRLPCTLEKLITSELTTSNLPPNLTYLKYSAYHTTMDEPTKTFLNTVFQSIQFSVKQLIINGIDCTNTDYTMHHGMEYLELGLDIGQVYGNVIRFDNVNTIKINKFKDNFYVCQNTANSIKNFSNFVKISEYRCEKCRNGSMSIEYKLNNFTISLGDSVYHLYLDFNTSLAILNYLDTSTPNNLQSVTISATYLTVKTYDDVLQRQQLLLKTIQSLKSEDKDTIVEEFDLSNMETIINFQTRFPDVKLIMLD
jgi:hypothetical protein